MSLTLSKAIYDFTISSYELSRSFISKFLYGKEPNIGYLVDTQDVVKEEHLPLFLIHGLNGNPM